MATCKNTPAIAQLVEHLTVDACSNQMVPGSIPGGRIFGTQDRIANTNLQRNRAHPDLNQGPADLQSAALTTELYTHVDGFSTLRGHLVVLRFGLRLFGTRRKASWGRLGWFRVSLCPWQRTPTQQRAWRPWKPLCHGLQPKCWMARLVLTLHALPWTRASASVSPCRATCACFYARRPSRRRNAGQDAPWEARTPDLEVNSLTL